MGGKSKLKCKNSFLVPNVELLGEEKPAAELVIMFPWEIYSVANANERRYHVDTGT